MHHDGDDDDDFTERRLSNRMLERRLFDLDDRMLKVERSVEQFPQIVEKKLKERADAERNSREAFWTRMRTVVTAVASVVAAAAACVGAYAAVVHHP